MAPPGTYTRKPTRKGIYKRRQAAYSRSYGSVDRGYGRMASRRMIGPPAALYPRMPTNATALKSCDMLFGGTIVSAATATAAVMVVPLIGAGFMNRLGNRTRGVSIQATGFIAPSGLNGAATSQQFARIMIIYDRQTNGAVPAIGTILGDTIAAGTTATPTPSSGLNINNRDRFMVLRDRKVLLPALGAAGATIDSNVVTCANDLCDKGGLNYQEFVKLKGLETLYNTTAAGTIADISAGSFIILAFCADPAANAAWRFDATFRFKFLD